MSAATIGERIESRTAQTTRERVADAIRQHADVVRGHDAVHPDRADCGGIGNCALMRAEHDAESEVIGILERAARRNVGMAVVSS